MEELYNDTNLSNVISDLMQDLIHAKLILPLFAGIGILAGLIMLIAPTDVGQVSRRLGNWYSDTALARMMETPYFFERFFYRHHRIFGLLITLGAFWSLSYLVRILEQRQVLMGLFKGMPEVLASILLDSSFVLLILGTSFSVAVGIIVFIRPSILKSLEDRANQWVQSRKWLESFVARGSPTAKLAPRLLGAFLLLFSLFALAQWFLYGLVE